MRAIAFAIVLAAIFHIPNSEYDLMDATGKQIAGGFGLACWLGFIVCVLLGK